MKTQLKKCPKNVEIGGSRRIGDDPVNVFESLHTAAESQSVWSANEPRLTKGQV